MLTFSVVELRRELLLHLLRLVYENSGIGVDCCCGYLLEAWSHVYFECDDAQSNGKVEWKSFDLSF